MEKNKLCCRIFPVVIILISFVLALAIWYFEEGIRNFSFLTNKDEVFNFVGTLLFIAVIPIGIFYWLNDKEKYQSKAKMISVAGFIPAIAVLVLQIFWNS